MKTIKDSLEKTFPGYSLKQSQYLNECNLGKVNNVQCTDGQIRKVRMKVYPERKLLFYVAYE